MSVISKLAVHLIPSTSWENSRHFGRNIFFYTREDGEVDRPLTDPEPTDSDPAKCGGVLRPNEKLIEMLTLDY
jgi:hypothetical protein